MSKHRVAGRRRVVVEVLAARDELLTSCGREEKAASAVVGEELRRPQCKPARGSEPAQVAGGDVELEEAVRHVRVVLEVGGELRSPVAQRPPQRIDVEQLPQAARRVEQV